MHRTRGARAVHARCGSVAPSERRRGLLHTGLALPTELHRCQRWLEEIDVQLTEQGISDVPARPLPVGLVLVVFFFIYRGVFQVWLLIPVF